MATGDLHLRILRVLLAGAGAFVAAALHHRGFVLRDADEKDRFASTRRDGLNLLSIVLLALALWAAGHEGPVALVTSGTLFAWLETWRHRSEGRAPEIAVTLLSMLTAAIAERWNVLSLEVCRSIAN